MKLATVPGSGHLYLDEQSQIWWQSDKPGTPPDLLADWDSLCGKGFAATGSYDAFRDACSAHDNCYRHRAFYELRGWSRQSIDEYFLQLMLHTAAGDLELQLRAREFYTLVRLFGGIFYYRHPTIAPGQYKDPLLLALTPDTLNEYLLSSPSRPTTTRFAPALPESEGPAD